MKIIVNKDRSIIPIGTWGTVNENDYEILEFEFPEELKNYNKRIVYYLDVTKPWDAIVDNKAYITNAITSVENVKAYIWCTKENSERPADTDFRSQEFEMHFYKNENADGVVPTPVQVDGFNTILTTMNAKIDEVDALEQTIETAETERQENENTRISNESTRQSNESTRESNEETRQSQEAERERKTSEAIADIKDKTAEYNANAEAKTNAFNQNATQKTNDFNSNYTQKVNDFNANASSKELTFNSNASSKTSTFNSNAETKTNAFNTNATNKTNDFNSNATEKTTAFDNNASAKTSEFNTNAESKTSAFNENATQKTTNFDNNATEKTDEFNTNAQNKIDEYDEHIVEYQAQIDELQEEVEELSENMPWNTTEQATEISVTDAAKYSKNKLELFGNTEQDNTKMTYKCDGTETGDYYLTYNSIDYYFTMPTIVDGDILVFNTTDLKLYLADTEITTESTGTGTNLTFISSSNPDYPQPIHVVTGENIISVGSANYLIDLRGKNKFDITKITPNTYIAKNNSTGASSVSNLSDYIYVQANQEYTLSYKCDNFANSSNRYLAFYKNNKEYISDVDYNITRKILNFTPTQDGYIRFGYDINCYDIQVEEGDTATTYTAYNPLELCKIRDYQDYLYKENGNWYKYGAILKRTLPRTNWITQETTDDYYYFYRAYSLALVGVINSFCDIFKSRTSSINANTNVDTDSIAVGAGSGYPIRIKIKKERLSAGTAREFSSYIEEKSPTFYFIAATPTTTQITDTTLISQLDEIYEHLKLVKGTNNITVTASDLTPNMQLTYMQDLPSKLNNLDSRLALLE